MHRKATSCAVLACAIAIGGCASNPDVTIGYYLPKSSVALKATRTVGCDTSKNIYSATAVAMTTSYSPQSTRQEVKLKDLGDYFSNASLGASYFDDGRLKGINASSAGKGEEIIASAIKVASLVLTLGLDGGTLDPGAQIAACDKIKAVAGDDPITIIYTMDEDFAATELTPGPATRNRVDLARQPVVKTAVFRIAPGQPDYFATEIQPALKNVCLEMKQATYDPILVDTNVPENSTKHIALHLQQPARIGIGVSEGFGAQCGGSRQEIWSGEALVPQLGQPYHLPIPRAALFGSQSFELTLTDAGNISSLKYGQESGTAGMLNAVSSGLTELQPKSDADRALEVQGQADLIAQQQRLVRCQAHPDMCE